jgi:hypothetical protein
MEHRLGRTLRVFLVVLATAGFYRLAVVPFVEPRGGAAGSVEMTPEEAAAIRARADRRLAAVGDLFPPGSWEREDPIMLESRQMRLLFKEYHSLPDGRVNLVPCTLVVLPDRNRVAREGAAGRPFVLRAPQGAVLEFDEPLDLRQGRLARLVGGSLRGQVTIRGPASAPGAEDDIEIVTRDIELTDLEVRTSEMVQFRHGRSSGSGRGLVARLTPREGPSGHGPNIGGVDSLRLDRDVRIRVEGVAGRLLPGREPPPADAEPAAQPPVLVSCRGSLCLNVSADVITLEDHVDVVRPGADGAGDRLSCDLLAILLGRRSAAAVPADAATAPAAPSSGPLEPVEIQAKGTPVVVTSAAARLEARSARLGYELASRRILLDGEEPVSLVVGDSEMEARKIDYCPGPPGDPGALMALGPGRLKSRPQDGQPVQVRWQQWLRMRPDGTGHVVSVAGDAEVAVETQGRLAATEMHLWLDVVRTAATRSAVAGPDLSRVRPSRLLARGMVEADAAQAEARTDRLELWFRNQPEAPAPAPAVTTAPAAAGPPPAPVTPPAIAAPSAPATVDRQRPPGRFVVTAGLVRGLVLVSSTGSELDEMSMEGQVRLVEQPAAPVPAAGAEQGIEIAGDQLQLSRASRFDTRAIVSGRPARVRGRGLDLTGPMVEFDRGRGRVTVDGAGQLSLPLAGGAAGFAGLGLTTPPAAAAPEQPGKLDVTWQGRMDFDGLTARFVDRVVTAGGQATVQAGSLDVVFDRPFDLAVGEPRRAGPGPQVARIACGSGVRIESTSAAEDGGRSRERLFARDLVVDRETGDVTGTGPGRLTSTRFGTAPAALAPPTPTAGGVPARTVAAPRREPGLTYLGVDFQRGLRGNIHRRAMEFHQRVEAVWGPVATWDDALDAHAPAGLPAGAVAVSCDVLGLAQPPPMPGRERSSIELGAGGNVLVEGESFTARSARLSWSEAKDLLVFEGDGRSDAQLFRQLQAGALPSTASAGKILYWRALNRVDVEDARFLDLDQLRGGGPQPALPATPPARPTRQAPPAILPAT